LLFSFLFAISKLLYIQSTTDIMSCECMVWLLMPLFSFIHVSYIFSFINVFLFSWWAPFSTEICPPPPSTHPHTLNLVLSWKSQLKKDIIYPLSFDKTRMVFALMCCTRRWKYFCEAKVGTSSPPSSPLMPLFAQRVVGKDCKSTSRQGTDSKTSRDKYRLLLD
jgi:hypothetical protein